MVYRQNYSKILIKSLVLFSIIGASGAVLAADNSGVPLTINNKADRNLYIEIHGSNTGQYFNFDSKQYNAGFVAQDVLKCPAKSKKTFFLPGDGVIGGGRIYISTHQMTGMPDLATYPYIYDKVELGWNNSGTAVWNTTSVDFFGLAMQLEHQEGGKLVKVGYKDDATRDGIMQKLADAMHQEPYFDKKFFMKSIDGKSYARIFSPQHWYTQFPNVWANSIKDNLTALAQKPFSVTYGGQTFTDVTAPQCDTNGCSVTVKVDGKQQTISAINTGNIVAGEIAPVGNRFAALLGAAANRGILAQPEKWSGPGDQGIWQNYYNQKPYNVYAKVLSDASIDHKVYGISYNDIGHMESSISVGSTNTSPVTLTILPFDGSAGPNLEAPAPTANDVTSSSATITWNKVSDTYPKDPTPTYKAALQPVAQAVAGVSCNGNVCSQAFSGLKENTPYQATVTATAGQHTAQGSVNFTTKGSGPKPPVTDGNYVISTNPGSGPYTLNGSTQIKGGVAKLVKLNTGADASNTLVDKSKTCTFSMVAESFNKKAGNCDGIVTSGKVTVDGKSYTNIALGSF